MTANGAPYGGHHRSWQAAGDCEHSASIAAAVDLLTQRRSLLPCTAQRILLLLLCCGGCAGAPIPIRLGAAPQRRHLDHRRLAPRGLLLCLIQRLRIFFKQKTAYEIE
eukprot:COSAG02_NODE_37037_length_447_cov_0.876437_1_plen_108_part_00